MISSHSPEPRGQHNCFFGLGRPALTVGIIGLLFSGLAFDLLAAPASQPIATISSPDGWAAISFSLQAGEMSYSANWHDRQLVENSALGLELQEPIQNGFLIVGIVTNATRSEWKPIYGQRAEIPDNYNSLTIQLRERGAAARRINLEFRAYNEGLAFRYVLPSQDSTNLWHINRELTEFRFIKEARAYPIYRGEQKYPTTPIAVQAITNRVCTPLTFKLPRSGFASVFEAFVDNYPVMRLRPHTNGALVTELLGQVKEAPPFSSPWRVIQLGANEAGLIENGYLVENLNPPATPENETWVAPGKTISNEGAEPLKTDRLKLLVDFAATNNFKYLQLDWGWYGTERHWTPEMIEGFRQYVPEPFKNTGWEANTTGDPSKVARGYVPYGWTPQWANSYTTVDLDLPELIQYCKNRGVGLCLYVESQHTLWAQDVEKLFSQYEQWGLAGLKPGFVRHYEQEHMNWIRNMVATAAKHKLWLCIHDEYVPDGLQRTYPNLLMIEGGGGQENYWPATHDVMLPFTRGLVGQFDYTPALYVRGKSHAHQLALFVTIYGPAVTMRGGYSAWTGGKNFGVGGREIEFLKRVPTVWDETRVVDAKIGSHIVMARRSGEAWFVGGMTGDNSAKLNLRLDFLTPGKTYNARIFADDPASASDGWCPTKLETKPVSFGQKLAVAMEKAGGVVMVLEPASSSSR